MGLTMPNPNRNKTLLSVLSELNNRSRWYSSQIWQIPFAYLGITGVLATLTLKDKPLPDSMDFFIPYFFILFGIIGLLVFVHMIGLMNGEKRAVENLQALENHIFQNVLQNTPSLQPAEYRPFLYVWPLAFIVLLTALCYLFIGFSLLAISKALMVISYLCIILGSVGMVIYFVDFPFPTDIASAKSCKGKKINITCFSWWLGSWLLIIFGTIVQLFHYLMAK